MLRTFRPRSSTPASASSCSTSEPKPPIAPSSIVISTSCSRARRRIRSLVERLGEARIGDRRRQPERRELVGRLQAFGEPRAERQQRDLAAFAHDAALADLERHAARRAAARRCPRRADSGTPTGGRRSPRRSPPCAPARPRRPPPSPRSRAGSRDRRDRRSRHGSARRRRRARRGRWRSAPAGSGSPRRARPGRRRAAGRSSRSQRTASCPRVARPAAKVTACCSAMPTSKQRSGKRLREQSRPVPDGIAAVMATIASSRAGLGDQRLAEHLACRPGRRRARLGLLAGDDVELDDAVVLVGGRSRPARSPCPSGSRHGPGSGRARRRGRCAAPAADASRSWPSIGPT